MGAEEKNMNEKLSRMVADLFEQSRGGEDLSPKIQSLRDEIKKVIESENSIFGKLRELVSSFQEIIPEEKQRYNAAIKALSTTSKLSREEIVSAVNNQLTEIALLEKSLVPSLPDWRKELKVMEATAQEMRGELAKLRERMVWLESEEKRILAGLLVRQREGESAEKAMWELFREIETEVAKITKKVADAAVETAVAQPVAQPEPVKSDVPVEHKVVNEQKKTISASPAPAARPVAQEVVEEQKKEVSEPPAPQNSEFQKKCSRCGGRMDFYSNAEMWQCYSCGNEELTTDEVQGKGKEKSGQTAEPETDPASEPISDPSQPLGVPWVPPSSKNNTLAKKKSCPVCRKKMQWYQQEGAWRCPFCKYERRI